MRVLIGIVVALLVLYVIGTLAGPQDSTRSNADVAPDHRITVESLACEDVAGVKSRAFLTVRNTGSTTIEYPKAAVRVGPEVSSAYLSPRPIRPGGIADAMIYNNRGGPVPCELVAVTDRNGHSATLH